VCYLVGVISLSPLLWQICYYILTPSPFAFQQLLQMLRIRPRIFLLPVDCCGRGDGEKFYSEDLRWWLFSYEISIYFTFSSDRYKRIIRKVMQCPLHLYYELYYIPVLFTTFHSNMPCFYLLNFYIKNFSHYF